MTITSVRSQTIARQTLSRGKLAYNDRYYLPTEAPTNIGFAAADHHFSQARMNPDILMVNADHDMRDPADMLVLNAVSRKQCRCRPDGRAAATGC